MGSEVGAAYGKRESWLPVCFIHRVKQVRGFLFVLRFEAALLGGAVFLPVETAVVAAV
jgi:hypothetical protein